MTGCGALLDAAVSFGPKILVAVLVLVAGVIAARWVGRASERGLACSKINICSTGASCGVAT